MHPQDPSYHPGAHDPDLLPSLVEILRQAGCPISTGHITFVFSASGMAEGFVILFLTEFLSASGEASVQAVLQSASRMVSLARDHWHMHERLLHEARHDGLTGLPNRTVAEDRLEQALARAARRKKIFAVFCIDLDGFKEVNDKLGHDTGDDLLRAISSLLKARIRHCDTLARMGGDEFLAIIEDCSGESAAQAVAQSLLSALQEATLLEDRQLRVSASIGVAMYPADGSNASLLRRNADQAMYYAKSRGGSQICFRSTEPAIAGKAVRKASAND
jgi:diguanylate cyclase (GGDEF)-like protein